MQSFDTENLDSQPPRESPRTVAAGRVEEMPIGSRKTVELPYGREIALYNIDGEFYAIANFCPHKGAPLSVR
jgi:nitrite reductase (NADH) small subunit